MYSNKKIIQVIGEIFLKKKIAQLVISPGSRNAPIIIHFSNHPYFKTYSIVDERTAGFFALGMSDHLDCPVVLNCTSGSALVNYYPAILEAFYKNVPLIILSADLPIEFIDILESQTIRQEGIFQNHVISSISIKEEDHLIPYNERLINQAINKALIFKKPIHINLHLKEPLYKIEDKIQVNPKIIDLPKTTPFFKKTSLLENYQAIWKKAKKKLILIGQYNKGNKELEKKLLAFSKDPSVVILSENLANIHHKSFIPFIDKMLYSMKNEIWKEFSPDLLISIGGHIVSKRIKFLLREHTPFFYHWNVNELDTYHIDTYYSLTVDWRVPIDVFFNYFHPEPKSDKKLDYKKRWLDLKEIKENKHDEFIKKAPFCDLKTFYYIYKKIPKDSILELGNSMIVRYQQLFSSQKDTTLTYESNRGVAGIDGSVSTAIGRAFVAKKKSTLIIGDLSFFYDSNALWNNYTPNSFRLILLNNGGGNIFQFIPGPDNHINLMEEFFETKHNLTALELSKMYKWEYFYADNENSLIKCLNCFWEDSDAPRILEIDTKKSENAQILKEYYTFIG